MNRTFAVLGLFCLLCTSACKETEPRETTQEIQPNGKKEAAPSAEEGTQQLASLGEEAEAQAKKARAKNAVASLHSALERYVLDESSYPGSELASDPERNDFPVLFQALLGRPGPAGPGGRSAPYLRVKDDEIVVRGEGAGSYRKATREETADAKMALYLADPWGNPYVYRCNTGKKQQVWMRNPAGADIYSLGPNGEDDTLAQSPESDDIGNW